MKVTFEATIDDFVDIAVRSAPKDVMGSENDYEKIAVAFLDSFHLILWGPTEFVNRSKSQGSDTEFFRQ